MCLFLRNVITFKTVVTIAPTAIQHTNIGLEEKGMKKAKGLKSYKCSIQNVVEVKY